MGSATIELEGMQNVNSYMYLNTTIYSFTSDFVEDHIAIICQKEGSSLTQRSWYMPHDLSIFQHCYTKTVIVIC